MYFLTMIVNSLAIRGMYIVHLFHKMINTPSKLFVLIPELVNQRNGIEKIRGGEDDVETKRKRIKRIDFSSASLRKMQLAWHIYIVLSESRLYSTVVVMYSNCKQYQIIYYRVALNKTLNFSFWTFNKEIVLL